MFLCEIVSLLAIAYLPYNYDLKKVTVIDSLPK